MESNSPPPPPPKKKKGINNVYKEFINTHLTKSS